MNTQKGKENQFAVRRQTLLASQDVLSKEIDEVIKMLDPRFPATARVDVALLQAGHICILRLVMFKRLRRFPSIS